MKRSILLIWFIFLGTLLIAQEGMRFRSLSLEEALAAAKRESKLVFMEIHTDGCGACVLMEEEIFPRQEMGGFFNEQFVCVSYNTSRAECKHLRSLYPTYYVPSFFLLNADGSVYHKFVGAYQADVFISLVREALNEKNSFGYLEKCYRSGGMEKAELLAFYKIVNSFGERKYAEEVLQKLKPVLTLRDSLSAEFYPLIDDMNREKNREFFYRHKDALMQNLGKERVENILLNEYRNKIKKCIPIFVGDVRPDFSGVKKEISGADLISKQLLLDEINMLDAFFSKDFDRGMEYMQKVLAGGECERYFLSIGVNQTLNYGNKDNLEKMLSMKREVLNHMEQTFFAKNLRNSFERIEQKFK